MKEVKVYTTEFCPYCVAAKDLLKAKGVDFEEINLQGKFDELKALKDRTGLAHGTSDLHRRRVSRRLSRTCPARIVWGTR